MVKRTWKFVDTFCNESDLQLHLEKSSVSIKRTEENSTGKTIAYRCSQYRKYPDCDFQIKVTSSATSEFTISTSNAHYHTQRAPTTRVPSPVREIVINAAAAGLSVEQTRRAVENQYKDCISRSQIYSLLSYRRSLTVPDVYSVHDFRLWCSQHSGMVSDP